MLLLGALLILTFPAPNLEFLAWFGLVPGLVVIVRSPTAREGGMRAWWLGAGYLIAALYWMTPEIGPAVLLVGAVVGALWIPFGVAAWKLLRPPVTWPVVYSSGTLEAAIWGAELAAGDARQRIYIVEPVGEIVDDPNLTNQRFPGNPTLSYRSRDPLRVTGEVTEWQGHSPEQLQQIKDGIARVQAQGIEAID